MMSEVEGTFLNRNTSPLERSIILLQGTTDSPGKIQERRQFLQEHPEERLSVDTTRIRNIIDYVAFKCNPKCSLARNEAVRGSDIDGGLVILKEEIPEEQQLKFVQELRDQGFEAYHETEIQELKRVADATITDDYGGENYLRYLDIEKKSYLHNEAELARISFCTEAQLEQRLKEKDHGGVVSIYLAGKSI